MNVLRIQLLYKLMKIKTLKINTADNIEVALTDLPMGTLVGQTGNQYQLVTDIPAKHKFATQSFEPGDEVIMYGVLVGKATQTIQKGELVSVKNIKHASNSYRLQNRKTAWPIPDYSPWKDRTFLGFHRSDGSVGTANYWLIIPLVFCENQNVKTIHKALEKELGYYYNASVTLDKQVQNLVKLYKDRKSIV